MRGGNGRGESTLLKLLAGVVVPPRGRIGTPGRVAYLPQLAAVLVAAAAAVRRRRG